MWSDNDIDNAFQRLNPPEPEPAPFPLDAWLRLETQLDKAVIERAVRRKMWKFFAVEVVVVALMGLGWLLWWPAVPTVQPAATKLVRNSAENLAAPAGAAAAIASSPARTEKKPVLPAVASAPIAHAPAPTSEAEAATAAAETSISASMPKETGAAGPSAPRRRAPIALAPVVAAASSNQRNGLRPQVPAERAGRRAVAVAPAMNSQRVPKAGPLATDRTVPANKLPRSTADGTVEESSTATSRQKELASHASKRAAVAAYASQGQRPRNARTMAHHLESGSAPILPNSQVDKALPVASVETQAAESPMGATDNSLLRNKSVDLLLAASPAVPSSLSPVALAPAPPQPEPSALARQPRLYVGIVGAPDVTTVKFASVESPLPNVGVVLEYRLGSRLRVNTGLLRSTKQYKVRRADYNFGEYAQYLTHRYFDDVDGTCTVLDVPLNLRYDLFSRPTHTFYGSVGLSSFFMLREEYSYAYVEYNKPGYWAGESVNANRHILSILNLSLGYERALSTRWSLHAEPYVKVPLAGVGAGKLKLTSAGVFLGVKYGF
jgi:hypothetical protein